MLDILFFCVSGAIGVGLYGNDDVHNGMLEVLAAVRSIDDIIGNARNQVSFVCACVFNYLTKDRILD